MRLTIFMQSRIPLGPGKFHVVVLVVNYLVTYHFHFFVGKFPKFFNLSGSMENSFLVASNLFKESAICGLQKILLNHFHQNFYI